MKNGEAAGSGPGSKDLLPISGRREEANRRVVRE